MLIYNIVTLIAVSVALSFVTFAATPRLGNLLRKMRIVGRDIHKLMRPEVPEMGGIIIATSSIILLISAYGLTFDFGVFIAVLSTIAFSVYGILDDLLRLGKYQKLGLSLLIGIILLIPVNPGLMLFIPLLFLTIGIGNIFNLFAGFNGLETGCTSMIALFFSVLCLITGNFIPFCLSFGFFLIMIGFLAHNKYPAKIFPGNVGTMTMGGFFGGLCLFYNLYYLLIPLLFLHIADLALKGLSAGYFSSSEKLPTAINGHNILVPGNDYISLSRLVLRIRPMSEKQLVYFFWILSFMVGISAVIVTGVLL